MEPELLIIVLSVSLLVVFVVVLGVFLTLYQRRRPGRAGLLGGTPKVPEVVRVDDVEVGQVLHPAAHKKPACLTLYVSAESDLRLTVSREGRLHRLFKGWRINREVQTNDRGFDQAFYLESDQHPETLALLGVPGVRAAVAGLFDDGFTHLQLGGGYLQAQVFPYNPRKAPDAQRLDAAKSRLVAIVKALPPAPEPSGSTKAPPARAQQSLTSGPWDAGQVTAFASGILLLAAGMALLIYGILTYRLLSAFMPVLKLLALSLPVYWLYWHLLARLLGGRAASHRPMLFNGLMGLVGIALGGVGLGITLNGALDDSPVAVHRALVAGKHSVSNKNGYSYFLELESWREGRDREEVRVNRNLYERAGVGHDRLAVETRAGALGFEWVVRHYPAL